MSLRPCFNKRKNNSFIHGHPDISWCNALCWGGSLCKACLIKRGFLVIQQVIAIYVSVKCITDKTFKDFKQNQDQHICMILCAFILTCKNKKTDKNINCIMGWTEHSTRLVGWYRWLTICQKGSYKLIPLVTSSKKCGMQTIMTGELIKIQVYDDHWDTIRDYNERNHIVDMLDDVC